MTKPRDFFLTWFPHGFLYERVPFATASIVFLTLTERLQLYIRLFTVLKLPVPM